MEPDPSGSQESRLAELTSRVWRLEQALTRHGITIENPAPHPAAPQPPLAQPHAPSGPLPRGASPASQPPVIAAPGTARPVFAQVSKESPADTRSLESRIGSQWFNRIGILAVLIAVAWFLKLAFDNHWIGPLGRVLIGLVAGGGLIVWSEHFRSRGYAGFSYSLKALGSGILYLSLWAAFSFFHLIPAGAAFAAMIAVTAFNGYMAWVQDAELLALYAIVGGFSTPLLVSTGENHEITLFSYLLLLDLAVLVLVALRPWSRLLFMAFVGTVLFFGGWWAEFYTNAQAGRTALLLTCFFLIFAFAPRLVRVELDASAHLPGWDVLAIVLLPIANAALGFIGFYALLVYGYFDSSGGNWAAPWLAVAFAAFYLLMLRLPARGALRIGPGILADLHLTAAVVFLTIAIPLKAHGRWITTGWLMEGAALMWITTRLRSNLLRVLSMFCLALGLVALLTINPEASATPVFNQRFAAYCAGIAVFAFVAWLARRKAREAGAEPGAWPSIASIALLVVNILSLIAVCLEIHNYWWTLRWTGDWRLMRDHRIYAQFTYSAFLMLFGVALLSTGFWRRSAFLRWQALVLLAVSIGKVFLVDVSELSQGFRILSFLGLGALLIAVSFAYQRDWLNLREQGRGHDQSSAGQETS
jgi:uncharacterized membrane protein